MLNLLNFNENSTNTPILTSPRSLSVCKSEGINPKVLIKKSKEEILNLFNNKTILESQTLQEFENYIEEKRKNTLKKLIKV